MEVKIILDKKVNIENYILIEGFPGIGLVGTIAAGYIIEKRKMEVIGHIVSDKFPPMVTIHQGKPFYPARIYMDKKTKFCVLLSEFVVPTITVNSLADEILKFAKQNKIKQIISLAGMTSAKEKEEEAKIFGIVSNTEMENYLKKKNVTFIKEGVTTGVSGVLIAKCATENFPAATLLVASKYGYPDPRAAALLIEQLDRIVGLRVDTKDLLAEAGKIEERVRKLLTQIKKGGTTYKKAEEELPMYG